MESQDIIQEFANKQTTETPTESTDILQEYVNSLNVEQKEEVPEVIESVVETTVEADVPHETVETSDHRLILQ